jgi:transposase
MGRLDWSVHYVDSTIVRAHQHAAGAKQGNPPIEALGRSQGGFSTKVHIRADEGGKLMTLLLTPGQQHEATAFEPLMEHGEVKRWDRGRPKLRPYRVVGDRAYSSRKIREYARRHGLRIIIPRKRNESRTGPFDRDIYRTRNRIERLINRLKQFRRLATRYEKRAENYRTMWIIAATFLWL